MTREELKENLDRLFEDSRGEAEKILETMVEALELDPQD